MSGPSPRNAAARWKTRTRRRGSRRRRRCDLQKTGWAYLHASELFGLNGAVAVYGIRPDGTLDLNRVASNE